MKPFSLNIDGRLVEYTRPAVMGIINVTPDSFYAESRTNLADQISCRAEAMIADGADMIDLGAYSSRPGAAEVSAEEETDRMCRGIEAVRKAVGKEVVISVDTFRASVAATAIGECGADIINDISGGNLDSNMFATVASLRCPYILMHMRGTPATMQTLTDYDDVTTDVVLELSHQLVQLEKLGISDIIVDPGFGFAKTLDQNYRMLATLEQFEQLGRPILVGVSRKSMISRLLGTDAEGALEGTVAVNVLALEREASILRVHDVKAAVQAVSIVEKTLASA